MKTERCSSEQPPTSWNIEYCIEKKVNICFFFHIWLHVKLVCSASTGQLVTKDEGEEAEKILLRKYFELQVLRIFL